MVHRQAHVVHGHDLCGYPVQYGTVLPGRIMHEDIRLQCPAHAGSRCDPHRLAQIRDQESTDDHVEADGRWKDRGRRNAVGYLSDVDVPTVERLCFTK